MGESRPTISTHVLDVERGHPAAGVAVRLVRLVAGAEVAVGGGTTDDDGRIADLLGGAALEAGGYRLTFAFGEGGFFRAMSVDFRVEDTSRSYHVPLIRAPFSLSTYRGS